MTIALISYLTDRGVGDADAGELTAMVLLPWTFKLIWGPVIDTMTIRSTAGGGARGSSAASF